MSSDATRLRQAAARYGASVDHIAGQYTNPVTGKRLSGTALLLKVLQGESSALTNPNARHDVSSTGARGWAQFMPSSRSVAIRKYGVDPWASPEQAVHAAALHLRGKINGSTGLEGYNPGMASYPQYILGQKVGATHEGSGAPAAPAPTSGPQASSSSVGSGPFDVVGSSAAPAPVQVQASPLAAPKFAAGPVVAAGYQAPASGGGPVAAAPAPAEESAVPSVQLPADPHTAGTAAATLGTALTEGSGAAEELQRLTNRADALDSKHFKYVWGGGHGGKVDISNPVPVDCSGAVSAVLGIDPRVSGQFKTWGSPGKSPSGRGVTIYSSDSHVLMEINGHFFGTSGTNPNGGAGWIPRSAISADYLKRFTARHAARLG